MRRAHTAHTTLYPRARLSAIRAPHWYYFINFLRPPPALAAILSFGVSLVKLSRWSRILLLCRSFFCSRFFLPSLWPLPVMRIIRGCGGCFFHLIEGRFCGLLRLFVIRGSFFLLHWVLWICVFVWTEVMKLQSRLGLFNYLVYYTLINVSLSYEKITQWNSIQFI